MTPQEWHEECGRRLKLRGGNYAPGTEAQRLVDEWLAKCPHEEDGRCDCFLLIHCKHCFLAMRVGTPREVQRDQPELYGKLLYEQQHPVLTWLKRWWYGKRSLASYFRGQMALDRVRAAEEVDGIR